MDLNQAQDCVFEDFRRKGFQVVELPFLAPSLEWRPHATVTRTRNGVESRAAVVIRENCSTIKEPHLWEPLIEARRQLSTLPIYYAVPESLSYQPLQSDLQELGIGLYVIQSNGRLRKEINDQVPFDDEIMTYPIEPGKPYRNRQNLFKVLSHGVDYIWWLDKHFQIAGVDYLYDFFMTNPHFGAVSQIRILGSDIIQPNELNLVRARLIDLQQELTPRGITVEMRLLDVPTRQALHDRYIISSTTAFNVLPTRAIQDGQHGSLSLEDNPPDFQAMWNIAQPL